MAVARDAFLEHQMKIATEVASVPPSFQLEAPILEPEGEEAEFTPVYDLLF